MFVGKAEGIMIIVNDVLLKSFHRPGQCDFCGKFCPELEPHHLVCRGIGGGSRIDADFCILAVGAKLQCLCHNGRHSLKPNPTADEMLEKKSEILDCQPEDIRRAVYFLRKWDNDRSQGTLDTEMDKWGLSAKSREFVREAIQSVESNV